MVHRESYVPHRRLLYGLLWLTAVAELGLTAFRIHSTRRAFGTHESIVAELLAVSILTMLWVPITLLFHRNAPAAGGTTTNASSTGTRNAGGSRLGFLHGETSGNLILWIMWLVGAAFLTHQVPSRAVAGFGKQGRILITIVALAWVAFSLLTLAKIFAAMEYAARNAVGYGGHGAGTGAGYGRDKGMATGTNGAGTV